MSPEYILIGAMKCGTTTLAAQLGAQAGIFMTEPKEPNYFSDDATFAQGAEWYGDLFAVAGPTDVKGEASTHYTKRPELPETVTRMKAALPQLRLIYMIRDPMARLVSHYIHEWSQGVLSVPLAEALVTHGPLVDYGRYGWQITPFVEAYGADAILLTSLERMREDQDGELARIAAHIGFTGKVAWTEDREAENVSSARSRKLPLHGFLVDNPVATKLRHGLVPKGLRTWVRERRQYKGRPEIPLDRAAGLQTRFLADREILRGFFPGDPSLDLAYPFAS